jgi:hypothetical protein
LRPAFDPFGSPVNRHEAGGGPLRDLLEPQIEVGSPAIDPDLPLYGGLIFVAAQMAIPWGSLGSSKYAHNGEQPEGVKSRTESLYPALVGRVGQSSGNVED